MARYALASNQPEVTDGDGRPKVSDSYRSTADPGPEGEADPFEAGAGIDDDACARGDSNDSRAVFPASTPANAQRPGNPDLDLIHQYLAGLSPAPRSRDRGDLRRQ